MVFIWFILERDKRQGVAEEKRDEKWHSFLTQQREANNSALGRLAEEIKANNAQMAAMTGVIIAHDNRTTQAVHTIPVSPSNPAQ